MQNQNNSHTLTRCLAFAMRGRFCMFPLLAWCKRELLGKIPVVYFVSPHNQNL